MGQRPALRGEEQALRLGEGRLQVDVQEPRTGGGVGRFCFLRAVTCASKVGKAVTKRVLSWPQNSVSTNSRHRSHL